MSKDKKYIDCALFLCGYFRVQDCRIPKGCNSSELQYLANIIKSDIEGFGCEKIVIDGCEHIGKKTKLPHVAGWYYCEDCQAPFKMKK